MTAQDVVLLIRDARSTEKSERILLWAIALRTTVIDQLGCRAHVSYDQLVNDTRLSKNTLRLAAKCLKAGRLLRHDVRANGSETFSINVALLKQQAAMEKVYDKADEADKAAVKADIDLAKMGRGKFTKTPQPLDVTTD
jgi:hypothetical protein